MLTEEMVVFTSHAPKADLYDTSPVGQYVNAGKGGRISFLLQQKTAGTNTGTATITVLAASDTSGTGATAVPFFYRKKTTAVTSDAWGNVTAATASGFTTTANENTQYEIDVDPAALPDGKNFVALKLTETVNDPVDGAVLGVVVRPRYAGNTPPSVLS